jgi:hypothetical protein
VYRVWLVSLMESMVGGFAVGSQLVLKNTYIDRCLRPLRATTGISGTSRRHGASGPSGAPQASRASQGSPRASQAPLGHL